MVDIEISLNWQEKYLENTKMQSIFKVQLLIGFLILIILLLITIGLITGKFFGRNTQQNNQIPIASIVPTTQSPEITKYTRSQIKQTTTQELQSHPNLKNTVQQDQQTLFHFPSPDITRDSLVVTENGVTVFERSITTDPDYFHPKLETITQSLGNPEREFKGSNFYGPEMTAYIYASKGITIVANPNTKEVFEIQRFEPMSVDEYVTKWGSDLKSYADHEHP